MARVFSHGGLRLVLLSVLEDGPKHGYEMIIALEQRFMGMYRPSTGTVYPRLAALEQEGLVASEESEGRRTYRLTDAGREELARRQADLDETVSTATDTVRSAMQDLQADIRSALSAVHAEVSDAAAEARRRAGAVAGTGTEAVAREVWRSGERAKRAAVDEARRVRRVAEDLRRQAEAAAAPRTAGQASVVSEIAADVGRMAAEVGEEFHRASVEIGDELRRASWNVGGGFDDIVADVAAWASEVTDAVRRRLAEGGQGERIRDAFAAGRRAFTDALHDQRDQSSGGAGA